jgi:hypothetical protein
MWGGGLHCLNCGWLRCGARVAGGLVVISCLILFVINIFTSTFISMLIVYSTIWLHTYPYGNPSPIRCLHTDKFKPKSPQHFQQTNNTIGRFFFLGSFLSLCSFGPSVSKPMRLAKKDPAGIAKRLKFIHDAERKHTYFYELHVAMAIISP